MTRCLARKFITLALLAASMLGCSPNDDRQISTSEKTATITWPSMKAALPRDPIVEQKVAELVSKMSLAQKVGQMMQPAIAHITPDEVSQYHIGSVLNGGGMYPNGNRYASIQDWLDLADAYWEASMKETDAALAIPIIWGTDAVHGHNNVVGATLFPHNSALGATGNAKLVQDIGSATAQEVVATGIHWNFSPTVAVAKNLRWGRSYESFSENSAIVTQMASAMVIGLQGAPGSQVFLDNNHILATAKHFIGDGATLRGDDQGNASISEQELIAEHANGYFSALAAGVQTVMASYSSFQGLPMHAHKYLLTDILKGQLGFDGLVVSDWHALGHVDGCTRDNCSTAINAGVDMLMVPDRPDWQTMIANTVAQVNSGVIPLSRIDDAVTRILRVKMRAGLFDGKKPSERVTTAFGKTLSTDTHKQLARQAVRESLVLLKNDNSLLPLDGSSHILVTGNAANSVGVQSGGWTISWQGNDTQPADFPAATSIFDALSSSVTAAGGQASFSEDGRYTSKPDVAIVVFGEQPYAEMRGDIQNLNTLEYNRQYGEALTALTYLKSEGIPVVAVFIAGRPRLTTKEINQSDAFVMAWLPGSEAQGLADVLINGIQPAQDFKGLLSFSWPSHPCPNTEAKQPPLFPFGYGLNYQHAATLPQFDENYPSYPNGCDHPPVLGVVNSYDLTRSEWQWHLELESLESISVTDAVTWQGVTASIEQSDSQGKFIELTWHDAPRNNAVLQNGKRQSLVANLAADHALVFDINILQPASDSVWIKMECGHLCSEPVEVTTALKRLPQHSWQTVHLPLSCIAEHRTDLAKINSPIRIDSSGNFGIRLRNLSIKDVPQGSVNLCEQKAQ